MRTIWKGAVNFGLVNIPVKMLTATSKNNIKFRYLHEKCNTPVKTTRYCPSCEKEVTFDEIVKGYEYADQQFVVLKEEDFANIPVKTTKTIDIIDFVKLEEIDPVYYIKSYYLNPGEGGEKPYFLLRNSLQETNKVAVTRISIRSKESLALIRVMDEVLVLETMYYADEVKPVEGLGVKKMGKQIEINEREKELAVEIINNLTDQFKPEKYENRYRQHLREIIDKKIAGEDIKIPEIKEGDAKVLDLMEKLKKSVESIEQEEKPARKKSDKRTG